MCLFVCVCVWGGGGGAQSYMADAVFAAIPRSVMVPNSHSWVSVVCVIVLGTKMMISAW